MYNMQVLYKLEKLKLLARQYSCSCASTSLSFESSHSLRPCFANHDQCHSATKLANTARLFLYDSSATLALINLSIS